ncbi:glycosyltransferase [Candidatus Parcubacteria bacterium]|nr:MAG: glycosyltransferase [Candidatus Parcubacteria bacterium]
MPDLSILIPSRNEPYLQQTVDSIFENSEADIEVLVGLDGASYEETGAFALRNECRVFGSPVIGQRAMTNMLAEEAKGAYLMKVDAHCSFGPGFDRILLETIEDDVILSPLMYPLDVPGWTINHHKPMSNFVFDENFVMQFAPEREEKTHEVMCLQGSAFMLTKDLYFELGLDEKAFGSWGSQGVEIGCKAWFNGKRCMTTKKTFYGHLFRTTDADFPYDRGENPGKQSNELCKRLFGEHPKLDWLREKFSTPQMPVS